MNKGRFYMAAIILMLAGISLAMTSLLVLCQPLFFIGIGVMFAGLMVHTYITNKK